jgi:hypothetical protein
MNRVPFTICAGDFFYMVGKIDYDKLNYQEEIIKNKKIYHIKIEIESDDIIRFDNIESNLLKSDNNIIKVNFKTGEKEYLP